MPGPEKKVVLITGCSEGGIGHYLALEFVSRGCTVYGSLRNLERAPSDFKEKGIHAIQLDVVSSESVSEAVERIVEAEGRIDVLVNNAGRPCVTPVIDGEIKSVQDTFETNVIGVLRVTKAVAPYMIKQKSGTIANIGSVAGYSSTPWGGFYSATKAAVHSMSDALRVELSPFGIDVVVVAPGAIKSNFADHFEVTLPEGSAYTPVIENVRARARLSQIPGNTKGDEFARMVVPKLLSPNPPSYITCGKNSILLWILYYFPPAIKDILLSRSFNVEKLRDVTGIRKSCRSLSCTPYVFAVALIAVTFAAYKGFAK